MDFSIIFQLRNKRFWWMDVALYFVIAVLIATGFCYLLFMVQIGIQQQELKVADENLKGVGTQDQKDQEKVVIDYRKKINDFNNLFKNHSFGSHVFDFMQDQTLPYIYFKRFSLDQKSSSVQLTGETDNMDNLSRQVANFEKNENVKKVGQLSSTIGTSGKIEFNVNLILDSKIFKYIPAVVPPVENTTLPTEENLTQEPNGI
jgi:hypothetical protein